MTPQASFRGGGKVSTVAVDWQEGVGKINECNYLFLRGIGEPTELTLELIVVEGKAQARAYVPTGPNDPLEKIMAGSQPIEEDATCQVFTVRFDASTMVSYSVLNESYGKYPEEPEKFEGKLFRRFSWSHLLEFTKQTTIASDEYPGVLEHYQVACLNHVIDVITTGPPSIAVSNLR